jgi:hypothetical protein
MEEIARVGADPTAALEHQPTERRIGDLETEMASSGGWHWVGETEGRIGDPEPKRLAVVDSIGEGEWKAGQPLCVNRHPAGGRSAARGA